MEGKNIKCLCGEIFKEIHLKKHIKDCLPFLKKFKLFDFKIARILDKYLLEEENIFLVKYLLKRYVKIIDHQIKKRLKSNETYNKINEDKKIPDEITNNPKSIINLKETVFFPLNKNITNKPIFPEKNNITNTPKNIYNLKESVFPNENNDITPKSSNINNIKTPIIPNQINTDTPKYLKNAVFLDEKYNITPKIIYNNKLKKETNLNENNYNNDTKTLNINETKEPFSIEKNLLKNKNHNIKINKDIINKNAKKINQTNRDIMGKTINIIKREKKTSSNDINNNKIQINNFPFLSQEYKKCKFCNNNLNKDNLCSNERCKDLYFISCQKILKCGHYCLGVKGEISCPPCLYKNCKNNGGLFNQNRDTCCQICLKRLSDSPVVILSCNHYIHYYCILNKLNAGKNLYGKKLNFDCIKCPVCDTMFKCPSIPHIQNEINKKLKLYLRVRDMIEQRLSLKKFNSNRDPFDLFIFYICFRCGNPYFAGINKDDNNEKDENKFIGNKEDCLCGKDSFLYDAKGESLCKKHGYEYMEYKCKFCCNIASRFCSLTHYCEECYKNKNVMNDQLCQIKTCNKDLCEFCGMHAPNGTEYCLGCFFCRLENIKKEYPTFND